MWIVLTLRTKYLQSLQPSKAVQEENCEWMFYHIQRGINNTHESPQGTVKLHKILHIFKQSYRGQCKVSNKSCEWVWDPPWGVLSSLGNIQYWCSSINMLLLSSSGSLKNSEKTSSQLKFKYPWLTLPLTPCMKRPQLNGKCSWKWRENFIYSLKNFLKSIWNASRKV